MVLHPKMRDRAWSIAAVIAVHAVLAWLLLFGLTVPRTSPIDDTLRVFDVEPPAEKRPEPVPPPERNERPQGEASPPNLRARATEIVAPPPIVVLPAPSPVIVAERPADGARAYSGASDIAGPGTGAGGEGDGFGGGGAGDGDGGGETPPRRTRGSLRNSDYPADLGEAGISGSVGVRYRVDVDGRARDCRVTWSSGSGALDATTCRLIEARFRFRPSRDEAGRAVTSTIVETHSWLVEDEPEER